MNEWQNKNKKKIKIIMKLFGIKWIAILYKMWLEMRFTAIRMKQFVFCPVGQSLGISFFFFFQIP